jgi:hypothetical protein
MQHATVLYAYQDIHCLIIQLRIQLSALNHVIQIVLLVNQAFLEDANHAILMPLFVSVPKNVS